MGIFGAIKEVVRGAIGTYVIAERLDNLTAALNSFHREAKTERLRPPEELAARSLVTETQAPPPVNPPTVAPSLPEYRRDAFLDWVSFINPGMLSHPNMRLMDKAVRDMPCNGAVIEIGSFGGLSLNHIIHMMRQAGRSQPVFSVDEWQFEGAGDTIPGSTVSFADYRQHVIDTFRRNVTLFSLDRLPQHMQLDSDTFFSLWAEHGAATDFFGRPVTLGGPISFAYIDGSHTYEQSMRDFNNVDRFLLPGGYIVFDDSADGSGWGSNQTAREAAARPDYEIVDNSTNYCIRRRA